MGNRLNRQTLHFGAIAVTTDPRGTWVDNVFDARNR
ncbi:Uncharacterised protein [Vibrio cholerae]|nr:Uncharacterised protein [Vibrio cholerae]CSI66337.1 Uncharacterised protein [Vibrio cholerae]